MIKDTQGEGGASCQVHGGGAYLEKEKGLEGRAGAVERQVKPLA